MTDRLDEAKRLHFALRGGNGEYHGHAECDACDRIDAARWALDALATDLFALAAEPVPAFEGDPKDCAFRRDKHEWRVLCGRLFERQGDAYMRANHFRERGNDSAAAMDTGMAMAYGIAWEDARVVGGLVGPKPDLALAQPPKEPDDELAKAMIFFNHSTMNNTLSDQIDNIRNVVRILARKAGAP